MLDSSNAKQDAPAKRETGGNERERETGSGKRGRRKKRKTTTEMTASEPVFRREQ